MFVAHLAWGWAMRWAGVAARVLNQERMPLMMGAAQCACRRSKRSRGRHSAVSPALSGQMTTLRLEARGRQQGEVLFEGYNSILRGELSLHPSRGPLPRTPRHRLATSPAYHSDCQTVPPHRPPLPSDPDSSPTTPPFTIAPSALLAGKAPCTGTFTPAGERGSLAGSVPVLKKRRQDVKKRCRPAVGSLPWTLPSAEHTPPVEPWAAQSMPAGGSSW